MAVVTECQAAAATAAPAFHTTAVIAAAAADDDDDDDDAAPQAAGSVVRWGTWRKGISDPSRPETYQGLIGQQ